MLVLHGCKHENMNIYDGPLLQGGKSWILVFCFFFSLQNKIGFVLLWSVIFGYANRHTEVRWKHILYSDLKS